MLRRPAALYQVPPEWACGMTDRDDLPVLEGDDLPGLAPLMAVAAAILILAFGAIYLAYHLVRFALGGGQ